MAPSLVSRIRDFLSKNPYGSREWMIFLLLIPLEIGIHELGHILAAKHFNCFKALKFSLWGEDYLFCVITTKSETVHQNLLITATGVLTGVIFALSTWVFNPLWHYLVWISICGSASDLSSLRLNYFWGKDNGFDRPMWHGPREYWRDKGHVVEIYEADDFPCYYE